MKYLIVGINRDAEDGHVYGQAPTEKGALERAEKLNEVHFDRFFHVARIVRSVRKER